MKTQMSTILMRVGKAADSQWDSIPEAVRTVYTKSTEALYDGELSVEEIRHQEASIYNSLFKPYGLYKPVQN